MVRQASRHGAQMWQEWTNYDNIDGLTGPPKVPQVVRAAMTGLGDCL